MLASFTIKDEGSKEEENFTRTPTNQDIYETNRFQQTDTTLKNILLSNPPVITFIRPSVYLFVIYIRNI